MRIYNSVKKENKSERVYSEKGTLEQGKKYVEW